VSDGELSVREVAAAFAAGELALVDVREQAEWDAGHVEGAQFLPMSELPGRVAELPAGRLAIVCRSGSRSGMVADWLASSGTDAVNVSGGMKAWVAAGLPIEPADGWIA
jgi:rhodanese-related sulfurtransferase